MQNIEVDAEVFEALQDLATPLVDSPNTVLRRLLSLDERGGRERVSTERARADELHQSARSPGVREERTDTASSAAFHSASMQVSAMESSPYSSLGDERRTSRGMSPRRFGKLLCAREFPGEVFERARRNRGAFRTMFESEERLLYFLNFNKPDATNLWYKVNSTALAALLDAEKPACVVFTNPAERSAWVIPLEDLRRRYEIEPGQTLGDGDADLNIDVRRNRLRELDWDIREYRREV